MIRCCKRFRSKVRSTRASLAHGIRQRRAYICTICGSQTTRLAASNWLSYASIFLVPCSRFSKARSKDTYRRYIIKFATCTGHLCRIDEWFTPSHKQPSFARIRSASDRLEQPRVVGGSQPKNLPMRLTRANRWQLLHRSATLSVELLVFCVTS